MQSGMSRSSLALQNVGPIRALMALVQPSVETEVVSSDWIGHDVSYVKSLPKYIDQGRLGFCLDLVSYLSSRLN